MSNIANSKRERQRAAVAQLKIEQAWETWPGRKSPADTQDMLDFFHARLDLIAFCDSDRNEAWRRVKSWLLKHEWRKGRR